MACSWGWHAILEVRSTPAAPLRRLRGGSTSDAERSATRCSTAICHGALSGRPDLRTMCILQKHSARPEGGYRCSCPRKLVSDREDQEAPADVPEAMPQAPLCAPTADLPLSQTSVEDLQKHPLHLDRCSLHSNSPMTLHHLWHLWSLQVSQKFHFRRQQEELLWKVCPERWNHWPLFFRCRLHVSSHLLPVQAASVKPVFKIWTEI